MICKISESNWHDGIAKITVQWKSDDVFGTVTGMSGNKYTGDIVRLVTIPGTGSEEPEAGYDVIAEDSDGIDALMGAGLNRDNIKAEQAVEGSLGAIFFSGITFKLSGCGNGKTGVIHLYLRKF